MPVKNIFLSASVPLEERDPKYFKTADVIAIRDSVIALASAVLANQSYHLIWGGHPSITPLITLVLDRYGLKMSDRVTLYQSYESRSSSLRRIRMSVFVNTQKKKRIVQPAFWRCDSICLATMIMPPPFLSVEWKVSRMSMLCSVNTIPPLLVTPSPPPAPPPVFYMMSIRESLMSAC